jgi:hypothetical protein
VVARPEIHANDQKIGRHLLSLFSALSSRRFLDSAGRRRRDAFTG